MEIVCSNCNPVIQAEPGLVCDAQYPKITVDGLLMLLKYLQARNFKSVLAKSIYSDKLQILLFFFCRTGN